MRWFAISALGALLALSFVDYIQSRWDKKQIMWCCAIASLFDSLLWVNLRLLDVLPENNDPLLLVILVGSGTFTTLVAVIDGIISASIIGDILDQHELKTGYRQEGMFNAALSFSGKAALSVGIVASGFIIELIGFPKNADTQAVPPETLFNLGLVVGVLIPLLYVIPIYMIKITRLPRICIGIFSANWLIGRVNVTSYLSSYLPT
ncbi:MAG: GPH family glycoside/pentoside/hexuronide:cation symporter [Porticoccaceae bacterium]